eukprot:scaffold670482_cov57-Prasinocladus_malaysianus.AAC.1
MHCTSVYLALLCVWLRRLNFELRVASIRSNPRAKPECTVIATADPVSCQVLGFQWQSLCISQEMTQKTFKASC